MEETFVQCPICFGWYASLPSHFKSRRQRWKQINGPVHGYTSKSTIKLLLAHKTFLDQLLPRANVLDSKNESKVMKVSKPKIEAKPSNVEKVSNVCKHGISKTDILPCENCSFERKTGANRVEGDPNNG